MKFRYRYWIAAGVLALVGIVLSGCENNYPPSLWNPNEKSGPQPVVTEIIPPDSAYAGVSIITIKGQNFDPEPVKNLVFFGGKKAEILSASATELVVKAPNVVGDSLEVKIAVHGAELFSEVVYYKLKAAVQVFGKLGETDVVYAIAVDSEENLYIDLEGKKIKKIARDGTTTHYADVGFLKANSMRMGPNNILYAAVTLGRLKKISAISPDGVESTFVTLAAIPYDLDFDQSGNMWVAAGKDVYLVKPNKSKSKVGSFAAKLRRIKLFNGYVYVLGGAAGQQKIWRAEIQGETLGTPEEFVDLGAASWLEGAEVFSFTFAEDGDLFLGTDHSPDAIFILHADGSHEILFESLIGPRIFDLVWGQGNYLYAAQQLDGSSNVLKIDVGKKGAPYYGRQ
ncbi:MAG TPA: hypothetical protein ENJ23_02190 [Bacteroidetes bacterium]|nr:hypothetical protein [Bacteroidota bacterium]